MRTLRYLLIALLLITIGIVQAQEEAYELPAIQNGEIVEGRFEENVISQLYGFYATTGDVLNISMAKESESDLDPFLVLLNSEGAVLAYDDDTGGDLSALISYTVEEDGAYFVLATSEYLDYLNGSVAETDEEQDYSLSISGQTSPTTVEDADIVSLELSPMSLGTVLNGESTEEAPAVFFSFEATAGTPVSLSLDTDGFDSVLYLFAPDGTRIAVDPSLVSMELEETGVYLVMVADWHFHEAIDEDGSFEGGEFSLELGN